MDTTTLSHDTPAPRLAADPTPPPLQPHLLERIVEGAHETIDRLAEHAAPHVQRMEESVSGTNQMLHERMDQAREVGQQWVGSLRDTVREHPLAAVATALAVGAIIARLVRTER